MANNVRQLRKRTPESEKIILNLGYVDLGRIDLLVQEGFYSNRTDFIRTAIRNQLTHHSDEVARSMNPCCTSPNLVLCYLSPSSSTRPCSRRSRIRAPCWSPSADYNASRPHSALGNISPAAFAETMRLVEAAA